MQPDDALRLARSLMVEHGVGDWGLGFDRARRRAGQCDFRRRRITLSRALTELYGPQEVRETVLHEVAHALVGPSHGHDATWAATARRLGSSGRRLVAPDAPRVVGRWVGTCPAGHRVERMRRPVVPLSCSRCARRFSLDHLISWEHDGVAVPPGQLGERYTQSLARAGWRGPS